jgi:hypothetical protein
MGLNGAKLRADWDAFCPAGAIGFRVSTLGNIQ